MVMMEGADALAAHGLREDMPQVVIHVGGHTTDLFWVCGMQPDIGRCMGLEVGVEQASDQLSEHFLRNYAREPGPHELRSVLRANTSGAEPPPS